MRKLGAALLAIPVVISFYLASLRRRGLVGRLSAGAGAAAVIVLVIVASTPPPATVAVPASTPRAVSADVFMPIGTSHAVSAPFTVAFNAPMDAATVAGALSLDPAGAYSLGWDAAGRVLTISPVGHWLPDTLYHLVVTTAARSIDGGALASPLHSVVLTARGGGGEITATRLIGARARPDSAFLIRLDRAVPLAAIERALHTTPAVAGAVTPGTTPDTFEFTPVAGLAPDTVYQLSLVGLVDADGVPFADVPSLKVRTVAAPAVVRFRPRAGNGRVDRSVVLSVRFTQTMDRTRTAAALSVKVNGKPAAGKATWAEDAHVLVFDPTDGFPYGATVTVTVDATAASRAGSPLAKAATETLRVKAKPAAKPPATKKSSGSVSIPHSGGGGASTGSWYAVEKYYLRLMNCTRTGGWVSSSGTCSSPGGRNVAALALSSGISSKVSRPYAKLLATRNLCDHFIGGNPGDRLRRAGYTSYRWAENLGCRSGNPYSAVLGSHLFFQSEKSYNGGHYRNLMNSAYDRVGIGVWVSGGRVRLVVDFYHP